MINIIRDKEADNSQNLIMLNQEIVNKAGRNRVGHFYILPARGQVVLNWMPCRSICGINIQPEVNDLTLKYLKTSIFSGLIT